MADFPMEDHARRLSIRSLSAVADIDSDLTIALFAAVARANADVAVVYRLDAEAGEFTAVARKTTLPMPLPDFDAVLSGAATRWLVDLAEPVQGRPLQDLLFREFPEVVQSGLRRSLAAPLIGVEGLLGILTLGRQAEAPEFDAEAIDVAERSCRLLAATLERDSLQQKLLERKLMERAKGILQARKRLSEHQAYLLLRSESRRLRVPMVEVAREIIETQFRRPATRRAKEPRKNV